LTHQDVPFVLDLREGTNTAIDFARIVVWSVTRGHLAEGDFFIFDGAAVHFSNSTADVLMAFLNAHGVRNFSVITLLFNW
jgi:hypothetical protein